MRISAIHAPVSLATTNVKRTLMPPARLFRHPLALLPRLRLCIARSTSFDAPREYRRAISVTSFVCDAAECRIVEPTNEVREGSGQDTSR